MSCDPFDARTNYSCVLPVELVLSAHHKKANSVSKGGHKSLEEHVT